MNAPYGEVFQCWRLPESPMSFLHCSISTECESLPRYIWKNIFQIAVVYGGLSATMVNRSTLRATKGKQNYKVVLGQRTQYAWIDITTSKVKCTAHCRRTGSYQDDSIVK